MISVVAGLPTLLAIEWFMLKEEKVDSTGYETNLGNLRSFLRVGYGGVGGAIFDFHLYSDGSKLYGTLGLRNAVLYYLSLIPVISILLELVNFFISLLKINYRPDLSLSDLERDSSQLDVELKEINSIVVKKRSRLTLPFDRLSFFVPLIGLFAARLYRYRVILGLRSGIKRKVDFYSVADGEKFMNMLEKLTDVMRQENELSLKSEAFDYILTALVFFLLQLGILCAIYATALDFLSDPGAFVDEQIEMLFLIVFGFLIPLLVKVFDPRLTWQTNYRYALLRKNDN